MAKILHDVVPYQRGPLEADCDFSPHQVLHRGIGSFAGACVVYDIFFWTVKQN